jgi:hypothetical protein
MTVRIITDSNGRKHITNEPLLHQPAPVQEPVAIDGNTSDGYHTFNELYEFRKAYNAALFNEWAAGGKCSVHKSWRHHDNELCFGGGWFIVVAVLPQGQISNHYEAKDWDLFAVPEVERVLFEFDGHTGADVVERLKTYTTPSAAQPASVQPVAWMKEGWGPDCGPYIEFYRDDEMGWRDRKEWTPLYTTPPAAQPAPVHPDSARIDWLTNNPLDALDIFGHVKGSDAVRWIRQEIDNAMLKKDGATHD